MIGSDSYRCDARHTVDERKQKNFLARTRSVRVRWFARQAIEGQRGGFPLLITRARACGALPYLGNTSSALPEEKVKGLGFVHFFHTTTTTTTTTYYCYLLLQLLQLLQLLHKDIKERYSRYKRYSRYERYNRYNKDGRAGAGGDLAPARGGAAADSDVDDEFESARYTPS